MYVCLNVVVMCQVRISFKLDRRVDVEQHIIGPINSIS